MTTSAHFETYIVDVIKRFGGEIRLPQMEMIRNIVASIEDNKPIIVEGAPGTGKTVSYLIPTIFVAHRTGKRVLIVTKTKKLQDQLAGDIPRMLEACLQEDSANFKWAILKGRNHFTCQKRITKGDLPISLAAWAQNPGGSRNDAPEHLEAEWRFVSGGADCTGKKCPFFSECPSTIQRNKAVDAQLVIANQTLLSMYLTTNPNAIPGDFDIIVVDEAQHLEPSLKNQLATDLSAKDLIDASFSRAADELTSFIPSEGYEFHPGIEKDSQLARAFMGAEREFTVLQIAMKGNENPDLEDMKMLNSLEKIINSLKAFSNPEENVLWVDQDGMHSSPIDVRGIINHELGSKTTILTSATIPDNFGLDQEIVKVGGGYTNAGLYVADLDGSGKYSFRAEAAQETLDLISAIGGRTLLLYTSEAAMKDMYFWLQNKVPYRVLHQNLPNALDIFREDETSVLAGVETCFEGVDISGPSLSLVIIDRLPFPNMGDPVYTASVERYGWFKASMPPTKTLFRQGVGRLLRGPKDIGVVAVLDNRIKTKGYGRQLIKDFSFQGIPDKATAIKFLNGIREDIEDDQNHS